MQSNNVAKRPVGARNLPGTEDLLITGGDARIALDPVSGLNKYGCRPFPDPALLDFGSSTASVISQSGFAAASRLRERLLSADEPFEILYAREMQRIRQELLADMSDMAVELVFAASGTDAHFMVAKYVARADERPLSVVMVEENETGSGVAAAMMGKNFTASGGGTAEKSAAIEVLTVALRTADGAPCPLPETDAQVTCSVNQALGNGRHVLLVMVDQSKTGMIAPGPACIAALHRNHPGQVEVLVDACQFRIAQTTLRTYLQQGFMVALTGSKFFTGPSFSAALLLPKNAEQRLRLRSFPRPETVAGECEDFAGLGLLLRWEAALVELRRFRTLPQALIIRFMEAFAQAVRQRLSENPRFELLPVPEIDRSPLIEVQDWDCLPSIFPFLLYRTGVHGEVALSDDETRHPHHPNPLPEGEGTNASLREFKKHVERIPLSREETLKIYRQLHVSFEAKGGALRCQLGQPVACGVRGGIAVSALRLCFSARLISDAAGEKGISGVIDDALAALDKIAWLVDRLNVL